MHFDDLHKFSNFNDRNQALRHKTIEIALFDDTCKLIEHSNLDKYLYVLLHRYKTKEIRKGSKKTPADHLVNPKTLPDSTSVSNGTKYKNICITFALSERNYLVNYFELLIFPLFTLLIRHFNRKD